LEGPVESDAREARLILVDTSVWVEFFSSSPRAAGNELRRMIDVAEPVVLTGIVVTEILQGLKRHVEQIEHYLSLFDRIEPKGLTTFAQAAVIYRTARSKGVTLTTIDTLIAAIAREHGATMFTLDRDLMRVAGMIRLPLHSPSVSSP
jgi:predicted nucleic acid-binding protein